MDTWWFKTFMRYYHRFFFFYFLCNFALPNLSPQRQTAIHCAPPPKKPHKKPNRRCHLLHPGVVALSGRPQPWLIKSWVNPFPTWLPSSWSATPASLPPYRSQECPLTVLSGPDLGRKTICAFRHQWLQLKITSSFSRVSGESQVRTAHVEHEGLISTVQDGAEPDARRDGQVSRFAEASSQAPPLPMRSGFKRPLAGPPGVVGWWSSRSFQGTPARQACWNAFFGVI